jgi:hypothetical protein
MEDFILIPAQDFCLSHQVTLETVQILSDYGLIETVKREETFFIPEDQINRLEKILIFNNDLNINLEGIETIFDLLARIEGMQDRILELENKLQRFL